MLVDELGVEREIDSRVVYSQHVARQQLPHTEQPLHGKDLAGSCRILERDQPISNPAERVKSHGFTHLFALFFAVLDCVETLGL